MSDRPESVPEEEAAAEVVLSKERCLPGAVLRAAREDRGLPTDAVAQITRFSVRQIEALERDDYVSLPGITAVRGFVRSYAKFLKIDATPLLAALDSAAPMAVADVRPPAHIGEARQPTHLQRVVFRYLVAGVVVFVLALAGYWYVLRPDNNGTPVPLQVMPAGTAEPVTSAASISPDSATPVVTAVLPAPVAGAASNGAGSPAVAAMVDPAGSLRVEFDDRSWIEVRDATQKIVFSGEYPAGIRQNVDGKAPFQLWIGKASGVRVFFGERPIDLQPYTRADVARLTVE